MKVILERTKAIMAKAILTSCKNANCLGTFSWQSSRSSEVSMFMLVQKLRTVNRCEARMAKKLGRNLDP